MTRIIKVDLSKPALQEVKIAAEIIKKGGIVAYPTDTCYGLGANPQDEKAINKLSKIKNRPEGKKFSLVFRDLKMIEEYCEITPWQRKYLLKYLPGPYTFILRSKTKDETIGVRIPDCRVTEKLSKMLSFPYTTTSANKSGEKECYTVPCILKQLKNIDLILDGGVLKRNPPSKIIDLTEKPARIIRK